jgi:HNH endonuclease
MPTKPIDRLMFAQGGNCFFCGKPLPHADASVEHLVAVANGGKDHDENCVACCKSLNRLFGHMSLKEKLKIILNQRGDFRCPAAAEVVRPVQTTQIKSTEKAPQTNDERVAVVLADLHKRGNAKPSTVEKLLNTIRSKLVQVGDAGDHSEAILNELSARAIVTVSEKKVTYALPPRGV